MSDYLRDYNLLSTMGYGDVVKCSWLFSVAG